MDGAFDLSRALVGLLKDGTSNVEDATAGPPRKVDGFVVMAPFMSSSPPHRGEMHPDGDELLFVLSGKVDVLLEEDGMERAVEVAPGQALVVPRGVWHRVILREPSQLLAITPGPGGEHR